MTATILLPHRSQWRDTLVLSNNMPVDWQVLKNQVLALVYNIASWGRHLILPAKALIKDDPDAAYCVEIQGPGGLDQLQLKNLDADNAICVGYNLRDIGHPPPYVVLDANKSKEEQIHPSLVEIEIEYASINYADVCIRWGLYESALRFVGWPICPGFDFSGKVTWVGKDAASEYAVGDAIYGVSLFGAYSKKVLVPTRQLRKIPRIIGDHGDNKDAAGELLSSPKAASVLAVAATALHAVALAKAWPADIITVNRAALIHSAAGGVGSALIQICKARGYGPIVAVVGSTHKIEHCMELGADFVIDKSKQNLWERAEELSPSGYTAIFDANGVETLNESYEHLDSCGSLVVYGFHSNLPKATDLSPWNWIKVIGRMGGMPRFDPMELTLKSKSISGFNLSFFEGEHGLIRAYFDQIDKWVVDGTLTVNEPIVYNIESIRDAHEHIQSGTSKGKIVIKA
jgi:NADPH:quinone reductase-like Zn-dependent oxidoreductase